MKALPILSLASCLAFTPLAPAFAAAPAMAVVSLPAVGEEAEVEVGVTMVSTARVEQIPSIVTPAAYSGGGITIEPGRLDYSGHDSAGTYFRKPGLSRMKWLGMKIDVVAGIYVYDDGQPAEVFWYNTAGAPVRYAARGIAYTMSTSPKVGPTAFKRELVYSGVSGGVVRLSYREFSGDLARPAFTQELTYDLADGDEIGFRGARFRVLKATNVSIRYVVVKPLTGE